MTRSTHNKTLDQTIAAIQALDLTPIKFKATCTEDGYGWSAEHADKMEVAYKRYLILHAKYPEMTLAPERDIDRFWHMHILDTRKYAADCEATFGHFVHHFPYLGLRGAEDAKALQAAFTKMQALYAQEFGEPMPTLQRDAGTRSIQASAAFCSADAGQGQAAFCSAEGKPAFCSADVEQVRAAFCSADATPAFCSADVGQAGAAFCSVEAKPAFCSAEVSQAQAAFCSVDTAQAQAAFCSVATVQAQAQAAFCSVEQRPAQPAFCSVAVRQPTAAFCSVEAEARAEADSEVESMRLI